jgi:hypothetical protein
MAKGIVQGVASGHYLLNGPDIGLNLHAQATQVRGKLCTALFDRSMIGMTHAILLA